MLHILTAGCAMGVVRETAEQWNALHPELPAEVQPGGSVDLVRRVMDGAPCDVIVTADNLLFDTMLVPKLMDFYTVFAGNRMVIAAAGEKTISSDNWKDVLLREDTTFAHFSPYGDPGGYRAVMAILLADNVEQGLSKRLMEHPGHIGMDRNMKGKPEADFFFTYYSGAKKSGRVFAELPEVMDLGSEELAEVYAGARFAVDETHVVSCTPIRHAVAVPKTAQNSVAAAEFIKMFLDRDFSEYGFISRK